MTIMNLETIGQLNRQETILLDCRNIMDQFGESERLVQRDAVEYAVHIPQMPFMFKFDGLNEGRHPVPEMSVVDALYDSLTESGRYDVLLFADENSFFHTRLYYLFLLYGHKAYLYNDRLAALKGSGEEFREIDVDLPIQFESTESSFKEDIYRSMEEVQERLDDNVLLIDVRNEERYLGISEPVDYKKGHIPGAVNIPNGKIHAEGVIDFGALDDVMEKFRAYEEVIVYCGSGMSATPMFTLLHHKGINAKLYAGSFSEWITDDSNLIETAPNIL
ncbi:sulfurtransferase [Lacicoccus alkaliphilus]|uniref:Sulfurtransferase n=1 Tax=Lacicoccus alkaliphilus DSM 16010 TaxID=1123231 RepID=A0A1M7B6Z8_9BACL|nr:rhodanese-like domain-containing protein [Salinicoccus alkaliphilus]SHL50711.1 thiosulfate/3-mercaptopyruvate sulfurtransferase [Salinicoccus alkaliphilus DSM 16010]